MIGQFIAVDVETANSDRHSICEIGLVAFSEAAIKWEWSTLVNPECDFDGFNVELHGIGSQRVISAPAWPSVYAAIAQSISGQVVVSHTEFDCHSLHQASQRYGLELPACRWLDTFTVAQVAWPGLSRHDLQALCVTFDIELKHHSAISDARACGEILSRAIVESKLDMEGWVHRVGLVTPASYDACVGTTRKRYSERIEASGDPNGPLAGHVWVCTGDFSIGESKMVELATLLGCDVEERVTKKTTILVVGQRDPDRFDGKEKSRKQLDAEKAIANGRKITIMNEREFIELTKYYRSARSA